MSNFFTRLFRSKVAAPAATASKALKRSMLAGARNTRLLSDWITSAVSIDKVVRQGTAKARSRARDLALNNPFARQYLALLQSNVIGHKGMKLQCQIRNADGTLNKDVNDLMETAFAKWARKASSNGRLSLTQVAHLAIKTLASDGEVFIEKVTAEHNDSWFSLHVIDTDLVDHELNRARGVDGLGDRVNEIRMGVEVDEYMRPVQYHVRSHHPSEPGTTGAPAWRVIPADRVLHIFDPDRAGQTRGISWFNSVMVTLQMYKEYCMSELVAARTASAKMGFLKYTDAASMHLAREDGGDESLIPDAPVQFDASPGSIEMLPPGVEFQQWDPSHPTTAYEAYAKSVLREAASGLQVSYHSLANDLTGVNYSSMRSGVLSERDTWRRLQQLFIDSFYLPVFEAWQENALLSGALTLKSRDAKQDACANFTPRGWAWVDPLKDVNASVIAVQQGFASRTQVCAETGGDYEEILEQLAEESRLRESLRLTVGEDPDPREVAALLAKTEAEDDAATNQPQDD